LRRAALYPGAIFWTRGRLRLVAGLVKASLIVIRDIGGPTVRKSAS